MKTRMITIALLAAAAITFAQPRFDWNEVSKHDGSRFQGPPQGHYQQQGQYPMQLREGFGHQKFNKRRAAMIAQAHRRGEFERGQYGMRGMEGRGFAPQRYGMGGMEGRRFAYPNAQQFRGMHEREFGQRFQGPQMPQQYPPYAFKGKGEFNRPQGGEMEGRRFAYPNPEQFRKQWKDRDFDGKEHQFRGPDKERKGDFDNECGKGKCPNGAMNSPMDHKAQKQMKDRDDDRKFECREQNQDRERHGEKQMQGEKGPRHQEMNAPTPQKAPKDIKERKEAAQDKAPQVKPEVAELKLKLRNAMIEKDYKAAGKIIDRLEDVDK